MNDKKQCRKKLNESTLENIDEKDMNDTCNNLWGAEWVSMKDIRRVVLKEQPFPRTDKHVKDALKILQMDRFQKESTEAYNLGLAIADVRTDMFDPKIKWCPLTKDGSKKFGYDHYPVLNCVTDCVAYESNSVEEKELSCSYSVGTVPDKFRFNIMHSKCPTNIGAKFGMKLES